MTFYIYENWRRDRGRIHRAECPNCNYGRGMQASDSGQNGKWHGPIADREIAFQKAAAMDKADMKPCAKCTP